VKETNRYLMISGGCLRQNGYELGEGKYYDQAKLIKLDLSTGVFSTLLSKKGGGENYPQDHPNQQYTAACLEYDILWLPTDTEIFKYQLPSFELLVTYSYPCFHNIHSVHIFGDELVVTSTGIDNVIKLNKHSGEINAVLNTQGKDPWHRFDPEFDYRLIHSTRPHDNHPNFVFSLNDELWVTRCKQEDAVKLSDVSQKIDISGTDVISVHDGIVWQNKVVFTRVDGFLVVCDPKNKKPVEQIDPFKQTRNRPVGWCRGLHIDGDIFYIGYSKVRQTKLKSKIKFLTQGNFKYKGSNNALVVAYNMATREVENVFETPDGTLDAIYGILPYQYE